MTNRYMKNKAQWQIAVVTEEMQSKTTMRLLPT